MNYTDYAVELVVLVVFLYGAKKYWDYVQEKKANRELPKPSTGPRPKLPQVNKDKKTR